jgi:hypothetical protein
MKSTSGLSRFKDWLFAPPMTWHPATATMRFMVPPAPAPKRLSPFSIKIVSFVVLALASFGGTGMAATRSANAEHGIVETRGLVTKVVAVGPITLHAYSQFAGGWLYIAPAVTGTDRDCQGSASGTPVGADRITAFAVSQGQVACLNTTTKGSFELLWHAVSPARPVSPTGDGS